VALDHDEYGAEHIVLDVRDGTVRRAYHYFAYPRYEDTDGYYTEGGPSSVSRVPGIEEPVAVLGCSKARDGRWWQRCVWVEGVRLFGRGRVGGR
jgi:hypothetical protein